MDPRVVSATTAMRLVIWLGTVQMRGKLLLERVRVTSTKEGDQRVVGLKREEVTTRRSQGSEGKIMKLGTVLKSSNLGNSNTQRVGMMIESLEEVASSLERDATIVIRMVTFQETAQRRVVVSKEDSKEAAITAVKRVTGPKNVLRSAPNLEAEDPSTRAETRNATTAMRRDILLRTVHSQQRRGSE